MRFRLCIVWSLSVLFCAVGGCHSTPKPPPFPAITQQHLATTLPADFNITRYLAASRSGQWTYRRIDQREHSDKPEVNYIRHVSPARILEGEKGWHVFDRIEQKLAEKSVDSSASDPLQFADTSGSAIALRFVLDQPMAPIPADLKPSQPSSGSTRVQYLGVDRAFKAFGELTRVAVIEGFEDVDVPAGHFADALRVRVNLTLDVHWGPTIHWVMYVWMSPQVGEVKCIQHLSGWVFIFRFASSFEYQLVSREPAAASGPAEGIVPLWKDGLIAFDRGIPSPRIGAMVINFER